MKGSNRFTPADVAAIFRELQVTRRDLDRAFAAIAKGGGSDGTN